MTATMTDQDPTTTADEMDEFLGVYRPGEGRPLPEWAAPESYPRMFNLSAAFLYGERMVRAVQPAPAEYVTIPMVGPHLEMQGALASWNVLWEMAQFRRRVFDEAELPPPMAKIANLGDNNVVFIPRTRSRYFEYAPLYHQLPRATLERHGLPLLRSGQWPLTAALAGETKGLPGDFADRLQRAWASHIWRHLISGSAESGFTWDDPIRLLAHNLDYWLPPATEVIQDILSSFPVVDNDPIEPQAVYLEDGSRLDGAVLTTTRVGSDIWEGEADAAEVTKMVIDQADANGQLRGILDAVRSNRSEDDFSDRWTYAREDFERKLHRKRSKVKVTFVELTDTIPVQGPESEVVGQTVTTDFMALLNERDRAVVVLLNSGHTNLSEIANVLGYANHSAVSKRLTRIRRQAEKFFD